MEPYPTQSAETEAKSVVQPSTQPIEEKKNLASRVIAATAFAKIFAGVINNPGQIIDANRIFQGEPMSLTDKARSVWSGDAWKRLKAQSQSIRDKYPENKIKGWFIATNHVFKYTVITGTIGGIIGAVLGWSLGDRIKDSKDILKHPWRSTKIMLGIDKPEAEPATPTMLAHDKKPEQEKSTKWQDYTKDRPVNSATMGKAV